MVSITQTDVADALHESDTTELPDGVDSDIEAAEAIVANDIEQYTTNTELVEKVAVYVACAFITGTDGDQMLSSASRETTSLGWSTANLSDVGMDYWKRAQMIDPTNRLGRETISFDTHGSQ